MLSEHDELINEPSENSAFTALITPLRDVTSSYATSRAAGVVGAECTFNSFLDILRDWIADERWFYHGTSYADALDNARKANNHDYEKVLKACHAHSQLKSTTEIM